MDGGKRPVSSYGRVGEEAARIRAESLKTRILALDAFCATAESELQFNRPDKARISVERIRHTLLEIEGHLEDPHHVSSATAGQLRDLLDRIRPRIEKLEKSVKDAT
jgi:hypothetical protein